jgi:hypothetical protein
MTQYHTADKVIRLPTSSMYKKYIQQVGVKEAKDLTINKINEIYSFMVMDFLAGNISTDEISSICNKLFDRASKFSGTENNDIFEMVNSGSELGFYIRDPKLLPLFNSFLKKFLSYGEKFK